MALELRRVLTRTGRYRIDAIVDACEALGRPHARVTVSRVLNGRQRPSQSLVEDIARAAGVDMAFIIPDEPIRYVLTDKARAALAVTA